MSEGERDTRDSGMRAVPPEEGARYRVRLSISGDDLDHDAISESLGVAPSHTSNEGDGFADGHGSRDHGAWVLDGALPSAAPLSLHVEELLSSTSADPEVWQRLRRKHQVRVLCVAEMQSWDQTVTLNAEAARQLSTRGLSLDLHVRMGVEQS